MAVPVGMPDHALLTRARDGDGEAFEALYRRHHRAATRAAHSYSSRSQLAEDAVQEAFLRILHATQEGGGPTTEFRAYLATTVRHVIAGWTRSERTIVSDDLELLLGEDLRDGSKPESRLRWHLLTKAFKSLPTRWQEALWLGEVEGIAPAELAKRWNMSANSAAALCYRARDGLRTAWLDAHVNEGLVPDECRPYVSDLSRFTQGKLTDRRESQVRAHLDECGYCRAVLFEVDTAASELRVLLLPVAIWGGLALAGAGLTLGPLHALGKQLASLGPRGIAMGAAASATAVAVVVAALSPALSEPPSSSADGGRPLVTFVDPSGAGDPSDDDGDTGPATEDGSDTDSGSDEPASAETELETESLTTSSTPPENTAGSSSTNPGPPPSSSPTAPTDDLTTAPTSPTDEPVEEEPPAPTPLAAPAINHRVTDGAIEIFGTGVPGATVTITPASSGTASATGGAAGTTRSVQPRGPLLLAGTELATTAVDTEGNWAVTPDLDAVAGLTVIATQEVDGVESLASGSIELPARPAAPAIERVAWAQGTVEFTGTGLPGSAVQLSMAGGPTLFSTTVDEFGAWAITLPRSAGIGGAVQVVANQMAESGLSSRPSAPVTIPLEQVTLTIERVGGEIVLSGTGEPDAVVSVAGQALPTLSTTVMATGSWRISTAALPEFSEDVAVATQTLSDQSSQSEPATVPAFALPEAPSVRNWHYVPARDEIVISGDCEPGARIVMRTADGVQVGQGSIDGRPDRWRLDFDAGLIPDDGLVVYIHQVVDGLESPASEALRLQVNPNPRGAEPESA